VLIVLLELKSMFLIEKIPCILNVWNTREPKLLAKCDREVDVIGSTTDLRPIVSGGMECLVRTAVRTSAVVALTVATIVVAKAAGHRKRVSASVPLYKVVSTRVQSSPSPPQLPVCK